MMISSTLKERHSNSHHFHGTHCERGTRLRALHIVTHPSSQQSCTVANNSILILCTRKWSHRKINQLALDPQKVRGGTGI